MNLDDLVKSPTEQSPEDFLRLVLEKRMLRHTYIEKPKRSNNRAKKKKTFKDVSKLTLQQKLEYLKQLNEVISEQ